MTTASRRSSSLVTACAIAWGVLASDCAGTDPSADTGSDAGSDAVSDALDVTTTIDVAARVEAGDFDSPYTSYAAMGLGEPLCRQCAVLRCTDGGGACAADPVCVLATQCIAQCVDAACVSACTSGDAALALRAAAYSRCASDAWRCDVPCFGAPEPRTTCGNLADACDPLVPSLATCCDGQGTCPALGGACCHADGLACDPSNALGDAQCCHGSRCDPVAHRCAAVTCVPQHDACTPGAVPCCDVGLTCDATGANGPVCCGAVGAIVTDAALCCTGVATHAGMGTVQCLPRPSSG